MTTTLAETRCAAHAAKNARGKISQAERANILNEIADRMAANLTLLVTVETIDNGKPTRESMATDIPLAIDHFRYFAGCIRAQEGSVAQIDHETNGYHVPRAAECRGPDHSMELPYPDGRMEAGASPRRRQLRCAQTGRADASLDSASARQTFLWARWAEPGSVWGREQFAYWKHIQLIIDVVTGNGGMFSLDNGAGRRLLLRSRLFPDEEIGVLSEM